MLSLYVRRPQGHKTTNAPPIMTFVKLFFVFGQTLYWVVLGVFHGDLDFFMLFISECRPLGHKPTNAPPIMTFVKLFFVPGEY